MGIRIMSLIVLGAISALMMIVAMIAIIIKGL